MAGPLLSSASQIRRSTACSLLSLMQALMALYLKRWHSNKLPQTTMSAPVDASTPAHPAASAPVPAEAREDELAARAMQEVVPGLWLGALEATQLLGALRARGIDRVVSAIDLPEFEVDAVRRRVPAPRQARLTARRRSRTITSSWRTTRARTSCRTSSPRSRSSRRRSTAGTACSCTASTGRVRARRSRADCPRPERDDRRGVSDVLARPERRGRAQAHPRRAADRQVSPYSSSAVIIHLNDDLTRVTIRPNKGFLKQLDVFYHLALQVDAPHSSAPADPAARLASLDRAIKAMQAADRAAAEAAAHDA
jgi:hypothetical protein